MNKNPYHITRLTSSTMKVKINIHIPFWFIIQIFFQYTLSLKHTRDNNKRVVVWDYKTLIFHFFFFRYVYYVFCKTLKPGLEGSSFDMVSDINFNCDRSCTKKTPFWWLHSLTNLRDGRRRVVFTGHKMSGILQIPNPLGLH